MFQIIFSKVTKKFDFLMLDSEEQSCILNEKLFFKYNTAAELRKNLSQHSNDNKYFLKDLIDMEQNELCHRILMFKNKSGGLAQKENEHTEIQTAL